MKSKAVLLLLVLFTAVAVKAQELSSDLKPALIQPLQSPEVVTFQLQEFLLGKAPALPKATSAAQWSAEEQKIRQRVLDNIVFHGWPKEWVDAPPRVEDLGTIPSGKGYRLRKLRYEIVPGFYTTALLYEPEHLEGRVPAVLNTMGHFMEQGNKVEMEQKLCINQALKGMIALNPEWLDTGDLNLKGNEHWFDAHLDLVGLNGVGIFYLAERRALDYLAANPNVDPKRIGVTGLSGGGWQTIILSSLDPRVQAAVPVAGFTTMQGRIERLPGEPGDVEQNPSDFLVDQDYNTLVAIRAPRPTLLVYNAEDNCCFRAPMVKPYVYDPIKPFFKLYGKEDALQWYENISIAAHNYGLDDREQSTQFFQKSFNLGGGQSEIPVGEDIKTYDELTGGIPTDNLTTLGLARKIASQLTRPPVPSDDAGRSARRTKLQEIVRYHPVTVSRAWEVHDLHHNEIETLSYRFEMSNGLGATGVWLRETDTDPHAPLTIILDDGGKKAIATAQIKGESTEVGHRAERGEQVLAADLLFTGDAAPKFAGESCDEDWCAPNPLFTEMLAAVGERPLGMEAAQLIGLAQWARNKWGPARIRLEATGFRNQTAALVAAALEPHLFSDVEIFRGISSLNYLVEKPVTYQQAPDLFCLDLLKEFDLDLLQALASPAHVVQHLEAASSSEQH